MDLKADGEDWEKKLATVGGKGFSTAFQLWFTGAFWKVLVWGNSVA